MKKLIPFLLLFSLLFAGGCKSKSAENEGQDFLLAFFTISDTQQAQDAYNKLISSDMSDAAVKEFHAVPAKYMTEQGLSALIESRSFFGLSEAVIKNKLSLTPKDIVLTEKNGSTDFSLTVTVAYHSGEEKQIKQNGQLTFSEAGLVDTVFFTNLTELNIS